MAIKTRSTAGPAVNVGAGHGQAIDVAWVDAPSVFTTRNALILIVGETGTGRTRLALTMPGPIALAHTAEKIGGLIQETRRTKDVRLVNFGGTFVGTPQQIADQASPAWNRMYAAWANAVRGWARTAIMDTDTEGWEILRLARFGELKPKGRIDNLYGPVNAEWRSMWKLVRTQERCSVIAVSQVKDEYIDKIKDGKQVSMRTGKMVRVGQKEMGYMADVIIHTSKDVINSKFQATIVKGWFRAETEGDVFEGDDMRLPYIMSHITNTPESEWS